jgi:glutathione S-transferase
MKVLGHPMSTCTRKVLTTLIETGTPYEFQLVDFAKGEHKQEPFISHQPFGQIPVLVDGDFELYESRAICRYINEKTGGRLVPGDLQGRARMEQWISIETSNFTPNAMKFVYHHILGRTQESAVLESAGAALDKALAVMDARLADNQFFAGSDFSIADISFMPYVEYLMPTPVRERVQAHANVAAWWTRVSERPSWQRATGKTAAAS